MFRSEQRSRLDRRPVDKSSFEILRYYSKDHLPYIVSWLKDRKLSTEMAENLPQIGWLAFEKKEAVGSIFVRQVEGCIGLIDGLITNPKLHPYKRHRAIEALVDTLIKDAKHRFQSLVTFTIDGGTLRRALNRGFKELNQHTLMLKI